MPASITSNHPLGPEDLIGRLNSGQTLYEAKLKALRDLKNQIIGNRTKKMVFLKVGAVPCVVSILSSAAVAAGASQGSGGDNREFYESMLIQSSAVIGSFACGLDAGVKAVLDAGAFPPLLSLISYSNDKVVDAGARSLKLIYQSKLAPKYDFLQEKNIEFLLSILNSRNENVTGLGAAIITHSCQTTLEQQALNEAGVIKKLVSLLGGSTIQRDASLESFAAIIKGNPDVASKFLSSENGRAVNIVVELMKDKNPRTKLLACMCLISIRNTSTDYLQDPGIKNKLVLALLELLDDSGQVGTEAPFVLSNLITEKEDVQKIAFDLRVVEKLCEHIKNGSHQAKRLQGILLALADLCSKLECCRDRIIHLQVLHFVTEALAHDSTEVRAAACILLKNVSRSVKNLSAGQFMNETVAFPLVQLLCDSSTSVQIAALGAISNMVINFTTHKSLFMQCGGVKRLVQLSKSTETGLRVNAVWALRNLIFLENNGYKEEILSELTTSTLTSLISDPEASVQEQALAFICNLVDGTMNSIDFVFQDDGLLLHSIGKQLHSCSSVDVMVQGVYALSNVASGNEIHKEAVLNQLFLRGSNGSESILIKFLQSTDSRLRTAAVWTIVNLTFPSSPGACGRASQLHDSGIVSQLKSMVNDPHLDVKLRTRMALGQLTAFTDASI